MCAQEGMLSCCRMTARSKERTGSDSRLATRSSPAHQQSIKTLPSAFYRDVERSSSISIKTSIGHRLCNETEGTSKRTYVKMWQQRFDLGERYTVPSVVLGSARLRYCLDMKYLAHTNLMVLRFEAIHERFSNSK